MKSDCDDVLLAVLALIAEKHLLVTNITCGYLKCVSEPSIETFVGSHFIRKIYYNKNLKTQTLII